MKRIIPYGKQEINADDIEAVSNVLKSDFVTQGPEIPKFENAVSKYCGSNFAVGFNSATSALHVACMSLGIKKGDVVWTSPISFVASANCVLYCGGEIDFVDIDEGTNNICMSRLQERLKESKKNNRIPKAIIVVHLAGLSCEMQDLHELSKEYNFKIIEDASHAIGGDYKNNKIGSCQYSDISVFSFHPVKIITSGEGGMLLTNRKKIYESALKLRSHGITKNPEEFINTIKPGWYYEQHLLGFNYRITDIHAALGSSQLKRVNSFISTRREISKRYFNELDHESLNMPTLEEISTSSNHLFIIKLKDQKTEKLRDKMYKHLIEKDIVTNLHYIPIYRHPYYLESYGFNFNEFPNSESYYKCALSIPVFAGLLKKEQDRVIKEINSFLKKNK